MNNPTALNLFSRCLKVACLFALVGVFTVACSPKPNENLDQTAAGGVLGAGIGAGAGMAVGNQVSSIGPGAAVGAGFGVISGAISGFGQDQVEATQAKLQKDLKVLQAGTTANRETLKEIQAGYDLSSYTEVPYPAYQVYFEDNATNLNEGAVAELEQLAEIIKRSRAAIRIEVNGHSDETGSDQYNQQLSEIRARNVATYIKSRGVSGHAFDVTAYGSKRPVATNQTAEGRQLNRRVEVRINR